jgi:hypothetical protein
MATGRKACCWCHSQGAHGADTPGCVAALS